MLMEKGDSLEPEEKGGTREQGVERLAGIGLLSICGSLRISIQRSELCRITN